MSSRLGSKRASRRSIAPLRSPPWSVSAANPGDEMDGYAAMDDPLRRLRG
jgi:hypothetical protein